MIKTRLTCMVFLLCLIGLSGRIWADAADAHYDTGMALLAQDRLEEAEAQFQAAIEKRSRHAPAYVGLGHVYLKRDDLQNAEAMFKKARSVQQRYAPAHNGLGLVALRQPLRLLWAIEYFRTATKRDPAYAEAYYNLAGAYRQIGDTKELDTYLALVKAVPDHADAWFQMGRVYRDGMAGQFRDMGKAEAMYRRQLEVNPLHYEAMAHLGGVLKMRGQTDEALGLLERVSAEPNEHQQQAVVELAMVYQLRREYDRAEALFDRYLDGLRDAERQVYFDLSLVAKDEELATFRAAPKEDWETLSETFWASRDPAPVTAANERRIEHYRRVAFAREHFGKFAFPWDQRGEIYVRYGEPDHVSSSDDIRLETDARVLAVKDRIINQAGDEMIEWLRTNRGIHNVRDADVNAIIGGQGSAPNRAQGEMEKPGEGSILGWPVYPVYGVWEYWIYTRVGQGIEVLFVQKAPSAPYRYIDRLQRDDIEYRDVMTGQKNPYVSLRLRAVEEGMASDLQSRLFRIVDRTHSEIVIGQLAVHTPSAYRPDFATGPMDFYFDAATFKGEGGATDLEVYFGVPVGELSYVPEEGGKQIAVIKRGVALFDGDNRPVYRADDEMVYEAGGEIDPAQLAFIPEQARLTVPPGTYRMSVQVLDAVSHKSQVYNATVRLNDYTLPGVRLSEIQLASAIHPASGGKFAKGDVAVVPNPTRSYLSGQPVYLYYEIYNLQRDEFGRTHYRVVYEVQSGSSKNLAVQALRGLGQLLGIRRDEKAVTIAYEQVGERSDEVGYVGLNLEQAGVGEQVVKVEVIDENAKQIARSTVRFVIR